MTGPDIRAARQAAGLSIEELAHRAEISYTTLSNIERGKRHPNHATLAAIRRALEAAKGPE